VTYNILRQAFVKPLIGGQALQRKTEDKLQAILGFALEKLAHDVTILDVEKICSYTDIIIVCHGTSTRQAQTIISHIREEIKKLGIHPIGSEGEAEGQWIILDYGEIVVHSFYKPVREFYNLEGIWPDARRATARSNGTEVAVSWLGKKLVKEDVV